MQTIAKEQESAHRQVIPAPHTLPLPSHSPAAGPHSPTSAHSPGPQDKDHPATRKPTNARKRWWCCLCIGGCGLVG